MDRNSTVYTQLSDRKSELVHTIRMGPNNENTLAKYAHYQRRPNRPMRWFNPNLAHSTKPPSSERELQLTSPLDGPSHLTGPLVNLRFLSRRTALIQLTPKTLLPRLRIIIQSHTYRTPVMSVILPDDLLAVQLPQARVVVGAGRHQVGRVGAEGAVPDPPLVAGQGGLEGEGAREAALVRAGGLVDVDLPDLGGVVGGAGRQLLDIGRQQNARDVLLVRRELRDGLQLGSVEGLDQGPDEDVALRSEVSK